MTLPGGWRASSLGDVSLSQRNGIFGSRPSETPPGTPVLRISAVRGGRVDFHGARYVQGLSADDIARFALEPGDLLFTRYNGTRRFVGICGLVGQHGGPVVHPDKLIRVVVDQDQADSRFINYQMASPTVRAHLEPRIRTTAGQSGISGIDIRSIPVALPPLDEQRRIVEILEDHLSRLDAGARGLALTAAKARAYAAGVADVELYAPDAPLRPVGDLLREGLRNGHSAPAAASGEVGLRTLTLTAVTRGDFSDRFTKVTKAEARKVKDLWLMPGDILIQRSNTPELVGTSALYEGPPDWAIFPDLMIRLRCDEEQVNPAYLATVLASERTHRTLRSRAKGLAGSMPKIDQGAIATLSIPVPADALHRKAIVDRIRAASDASARLTSVIESSQRQGDQLRRALLSSAFAGRLTATRDVPSMIGEMAGV